MGNEDDGPVGIEIDGAKDIRISNMRVAAGSKPFQVRDSDSVSIEGTRVLGREPPSIPSGVPFPVLCPRCKTIFASRFIRASASTNIRLNGNLEPCINCAYPYAEVSNGVFDVTHDFAELISGPDITREMLKVLLDTTKNLESGSITPKEAEEIFDDIRPGLGSVIKRSLELSPAVFQVLRDLIVIFLTLYFGNEQLKSNATSDVSVSRSLHLQEEILKTLQGTKYTVQGPKYNSQSRTARPGVTPDTSIHPPRTVKVKASNRSSAAKAKRKAELERRKALNPKPRRR